MRLSVILGSIILALLIVVLTLPSARDTSVASWWTRVRYQAAIAFRIALVLGVVAMTLWFVLPLLGWG
jgi:hypothetical protein